MFKTIPAYSTALLLITFFFPISASSQIDSTDITDKYHSEDKTLIVFSADSSRKPIDSISIPSKSKLTTIEIKSEVLKYHRMFGWGCVLAGTGAVMSTTLAYFVLTYMVGNHFYFEEYLLTGVWGIIGTGSLAGGTVMISVGHKRARRYSQQLSVGIEFSGPQITFSLYKRQ
jgi:hypothetical protein